MKKTFSLLFASLMLVSLPVLATMYRYVDESGQVVYTQFCPAPGVEAHTVEAPPPPPSTAKDSQQELLDNLQKNADAREDKKEAEEETEKTEKKQADQERMKRNCEAARKNLKILENRGNRKLLDKDGNVLDLSNEQQMQQRLQRAREVIQRDCK